MGYYSRVRGEINFTPPVSRGEVPDEWFEADWDRSWFYLEPDEEVEFVPGGPASDTIAVATDESGKAYGVETELQDMIDKLGEREYTGEIRVEGEGGDVFRYFIQYGPDGSPQVQEWEAKLLWPDGSTETITH